MSGRRRPVRAIAPSSHLNDHCDDNDSTNDDDGAEEQHVKSYEVILHGFLSFSILLVERHNIVRFM